MKTSFTVLFSGLLLSTSIHPVWGQNSPLPNDTLRASLADIWIMAEAHSRAVRMANIQNEIHSEKIKDAQAERLPEFSVGGNIERATNIPIYDHGLFSKPSQHEVIHTLYKVGSDAYLNLYNGNKQNLKIKAEQTLQQITQIEKDKTLSDIRYQCAALYLDIQRSLIFRDLVTKDISDQQKQVEEISALYKNGVVLKSDVLRIQLELSRRTLTEVQIENDIRIATQKLNILIGQADNRPLLPMEIQMAALGDKDDYETLLAKAYQHAFNYHISEEQTKLSRIRLREAQGNRRPSVGLYGSFYFANPQIFLYPYNPYLYSLGIAGVKVSFPISSLYHDTHKIQAAKLELEQEEEAHKDLEDQLRQRVKEIYLRYQEALVQIGIAEQNVEQATENARIIKNTYFHQTALITDLLDADIQLLQSRFELASAKIQAKNNYYLLENIIGNI